MYNCVNLKYSKLGNVITKADALLLHCEAETANQRPRTMSTRRRPDEDSIYPCVSAVLIKRRHRASQISRTAGFD